MQQLFQMLFLQATTLRKYQYGTTTVSGATTAATLAAFTKPKSDCWCYKYPEYLYSYFDLQYHKPQLTTMDTLVQH